MKHMKLSIWCVRLIECVVVRTHYEPSVHTTTPQVWRVLCQVHRPQPLHDSVVGPLDHLIGSKLVLSAENRHTMGCKQINTPFFLLNTTR